MKSYAFNMAQNYGVCVNVYACVNFLINSGQSTSRNYFMYVNIIEIHLVFNDPLRTGFIMVALYYTQLHAKMSGCWFGTNLYTLV